LGTAVANAFTVWVTLSEKSWQKEYNKDKIISKGPYGEADK
jgi:hypothetical protein